MTWQDKGVKRMSGGGAKAWAWWAFYATILVVALWVVVRLVTG